LAKPSPITKSSTNSAKPAQPQARGGMSSFSKKYNKLIPYAGGVVYKAEDTKLNPAVAG